MKKFFILLGFIACVFGLISCNAKNKDEKLPKVGILQLVEHEALDAAYHGFIDGLSQSGYIDGKTIIVDYENAQGDQSNCVTIANKLVDEKSSLILAIATPAAQAVANTTSEIPILITAVTDPASAKLVASNQMPGGNVTGTSDLNPVADQIKLLTKILPNAKKVAMLYCSSEQNSVFQVELAKQAAKTLGLETFDATVSASNEIQQVVQSLVGKADAIYAPTDNMIASGMSTVSMVSNENGIPIICGEENMVKAGGLATYGVNYYELGKQTATMAVDILKGKKKPSDMPIQYLQKYNLVVNNDVAKSLGIKIPEGL